MERAVVLVERNAYRLPSVESVKEQCPAEAYLNTLGTPQSRRGMLSTLNVICELLGMDRVVERRLGQRGAPRVVSYRYFPWRELKPGHRAMVDQRGEEAGYAAAYLNKIHAALSGIYIQLKILGCLTQPEFDEAMLIKWHLIPKTITPPQKRPISPEEFTRMLKAGELDRSNAHRVRNDAVLWILWGCGLRRAEMVVRREKDKIGKVVKEKGLTLSCYDPVERVMVIELKRKSRFVPLAPRVHEALEAWLSVRGRKPGPIFTYISRDGYVDATRPLDYEAILHIVKLRALQATPRVENMTAHRWRHNLATTLMNEGVPLGQIALLLGHSSLQTLINHYLNPEEATLHQAVRKMPMLDQNDPGPGD